MLKKAIAFILQGGRGGTHEYIKMLLNNLDENKYDITVICHGEVYDDLNKLGYKTHYVEMVRNISPVKDFMALIMVLYFLKKNKIDIVYSHSSKAGVIGRCAAKLSGIPSMYIPQGWSFNMNVSRKKKFLYLMVEKIASRFGGKIIAISQSEYNDALHNGVAKEDKLVLITSGTDLNRFNKKQADIVLKNSLKTANYKVVGMIGRLTEQKEPQTFVRVASMVVSEYPACKFILVGDGELKNCLLEMINDLGIENNFIITGWVSNTEDYISIMDIGVLTSRWEGFGLVLAEMMACGKPVVASRVDGIPFVVEDNVDGFLCNPDSPEEFAKYILMLLRDDELYHRMSDAAYKNARSKFDIKRIVGQHEEIFDTL